MSGYSSCFCINSFPMRHMHSYKAYKAQLLRQSLSGNFHGFRASGMFIFSQTPLWVISRYTEMVRADLSEPGRLFDFRLCIITIGRALHGPYTKLFVWFNYLVGTIWHIRKEEILWDLWWHRFAYISAHRKAIDPSCHEILGLILQMFYIWKERFGSNSWGVFSTDRVRALASRQSVQSEIKSRVAKSIGINPEDVTPDYWCIHGPNR